MKATELIAELQKLVDEHGDRDVESLVRRDNPKSTDMVKGAKTGIEIYREEPTGKKTFWLI